MDPTPLTERAEESEPCEESLVCHAERSAWERRVGDGTLVAHGTVPSPSCLAVCVWRRSSAHFTMTATSSVAVVIALAAVLVSRLASLKAASS